MNVGGLGAMAGGLAGGYFAGQKNQRENTLTDLYKRTVDNQLSASQEMAQAVHDAGHPELAQAIVPGFKAKAKAAPNKGPNWSGAANPEPPMASGMTLPGGEGTPQAGV